MFGGMKVFQYSWSIGVCVVCVHAHMFMGPCACMEDCVCITKGVLEICVWNATISNILPTCSYVMHVILETTYVSPWVSPIAKAKIMMLLFIFHAQSNKKFILRCKHSPDFHFTFVSYWVTQTEDLVQWLRKKPLTKCLCWRLKGEILSKTKNQNYTTIIHQ